MAPQKDARDDIAMRWRRLRYRASHRGTRELDLMLGPYTDSAPAEELERLELLIAEQDTDLQAWLLGREPPPTSADSEMIERIRNFAVTAHGHR